MSLKTVIVWISRKGQEEVAHILHLPFIERVMHPASRRPLFIMAASITIMVLSSTLAKMAHWVSHHTYVPEVCIDAFAYFSHGMGAIPFVKYVEPVWAILYGAEKIAETVVETTEAVSATEAMEEMV